MKLILKIFFRVSLLNTIYINFKFLDFKEAIKFPILVYRGHKLILKGNGKIEINKDELKFGIIHLGKAVDDYPSNFLPIQIKIKYCIKFTGPCIISGGSNISSIGGLIEFGKFCTVGGGVLIKSFESIHVGDGTRIVANSTIMDTNIHYIKDVVTGRVEKNHERIHIGSFCWINKGAMISKGTILPDYTIVTQNSYVNKNFQDHTEETIIIGGAPAKIISRNKIRIFSPKLEKSLKNQFSNRNNNFVDLEKGLSENELEELRNSKFYNL